MTHLVVFSHLRWDFVYQRPQQLLSRLAVELPVLYVEEPMLHDGPPQLECHHPCRGVTVLRPRLPGKAPGFHDDNIPLLRALVRGYLQTSRIGDYWLWFYTPMAVPAAAELSPRGVVYDCMDELASFHLAPPQLLDREQALLRMADIVFTGGRSLYEAKRKLHPAVHCFPSSVDAAHFRRTADAPGHPLQWALPRPRLGYCGVLDERIDMSIFEALAAQHPHWQIVAVGPVAKIDPASLPQAPNLHWLGQQPYAQLPALMHGWDCGLMPFALNEATRYISPTKTLEYLAAGLPVVSTPVRDVVGSFGGVVSIAHGAVAFVHACEAALAVDEQERLRQASARRAVLHSTSWDRTAAQMHRLLAQAGRDKLHPAGMLRHREASAGTEPATAALMATRPGTPAA